MESEDEQTEIKVVEPTTIISNIKNINNELETQIDENSKLISDI